MSMTAQLEIHDDAKQVRKKSVPSNVVSMKSVTGVKRIEAPVASGATLRDGGNFIRLDIQTDRVGVEELYLSLDNREVFEDWLTDLEFLVRLPDLIIPLSFVPKRELPLTQQTSISKAIFGEIEFGSKLTSYNLIILLIDSIICRGCMSCRDATNRARDQMAVQQPFLYSRTHSDYTCILGSTFRSTRSHIQCNIC